jgi:hypothetical protein
VALPEGIGADPNPLVAVPNPGPILFLNVDVGGQSLVGIQLSRPPGSPGSQGIQVVVANRLQYPVGEEAPPRVALMALEPPVEVLLLGFVAFPVGGGLYMRVLLLLLGGLYVRVGGGLYMRVLLFPGGGVSAPEHGPPAQ